MEEKTQPIMEEASHWFQNVVETFQTGNVTLWLNDEKCCCCITTGLVLLVILVVAITTNWSWSDKKGKRLTEAERLKSELTKADRAVKGFVSTPSGRRSTRQRKQRQRSNDSKSPSSN